MIQKLHVSKNLFDDWAAVGVLTSTGTIDNSSTYANYRTTDYIPVEEGSYTFSLDNTVYEQYNNTSSRYAFYDEDKVFINYEISLMRPARFEWTFAAPSNAKYVRLTGRISDDNIMLNTGQTALPYEPYGNTWNTKSYAKIVDTTQQVTSFPVVVRPMENAIPSWTIKGNMVQDGTPTPTTPITPSECGEMTSNLLNTTGAQSGYISSNGSITQGHDNLMYTDYIEIPLNSEYLTQSSTYTMNSPALCFYDSSKTYISGEAFSGATTKTFQVPNGAKYIRTSYRVGSSFGNTMLNTGSTAIPYQPYGYKLDIKSGNTTTPVYLGQVQSTRKIGKYEFTGQETAYEYDANNGIYRFRLSELSIERLSNTDIIVSHFSKATSTAEIQDGQYSIGTNYIYLRITSITSGSDFKTYLSAQYAAGTPVCVWYVLANETTSVVNEPLRKIGTYSDSVSGTNLSVTAQSPTTIDVDTSLKPSEMDLTYTGKKMCGRKRKSANLFDGTVASLDYYVSSSTGGLVENVNYFASDYIEVEQGEEYYWNDVQRGNAGAFYDSNKTFISGWNSSQTRYIFTVPSGAKYVRLTGDKPAVDAYMLSKGSTALPYAPYWK